ncbi:ScyD/ScyE family protein [Geodermatophilus sp. CPCC 206100]|uniref:ScyD/ScyE family protein n=1 Tax=Geodermatophilus sp. CPCC 206100 TaxID=3020054 RepID=UPI003B0031AB
MGTTAFALVVAPAAVAQAGGEHDGGGGVVEVAAGLSGPRGLADHEEGGLLVAESETSEVSSVDPWTGDVQTVIRDVQNVQGVDYRDGLVFVAVGSAEPEPGAAPPPEPPGVGEGGPGLLVFDTDGRELHEVDTLAYELARNPDGQVQFVEGAPVDALSNPFAVLAQRHRVLIADAGGNAVLAVDTDDGEVSTFFVPPTVTDVEGCENANPGTQGCDPVPTGVVEGPDGLIYVSTLGAEVPGAARVYVLSPRGDVVHVIPGLHAATGVEVDRRGNVYVSELIEGAPETEVPPPGFDLSTVGQVVRIAPDGDRSYAQVPLPTGLAIQDGELYASAWSLPLDPAQAGRVVRIGDDAFTG